MTQKKSSEVNKAVAVGIAGLAIAGLAGAYFLYGSKNAAKNRKKVSAWALRAKAEIMDKLEKVKEVSEERFHTIVDEATQKYGSKVKDLSAADVTAFATGLKKHWKDIKKEVSGTKKASKKKAK